MESYLYSYMEGNTSNIKAILEPTLCFPREKNEINLQAPDILCNSIFWTLIFKPTELI